MANDNKETGEAGFSGYRFLMEAEGERQFAVQFKNGRPVQPVRVFSEAEGDNVFRANEKAFAFDDEVKVSSTAAGQLRVAATAYQITVNAAGRPGNIKTVAVEYDVVFTQQPDNPVTFTLTAPSAMLLQETGFSPDFPAEITGALGSSSANAVQSEGGLFLPARDIMQGIAFPPQHGGRATLAREGVQKTPEPAGETPPCMMVDPQTLAETKDLGGGERLKTVFNFEAARVTEIFTAPGQQPAITGHPFSEHDDDALAAAFARLKKMGGAPKPLAQKASLKIRRPANG